MTTENETEGQKALKVLLCGGLAGVVTWASIFPLDVIKTRVQTQSIPTHQEQRLLLESPQQKRVGRSGQHGAIEMAKDAYRVEGIRVFFRGLSVCSVRAFIVNAVQVRCNMDTAAGPSLKSLLVDRVRVDHASTKATMMYIYELYFETFPRCQNEHEVKRACLYSADLVSQDESRHSITRGSWHGI